MEGGVKPEHVVKRATSTTSRRLPVSAGAVVFGDQFHCPIPQHTPVMAIAAPPQPRKRRYLHKPKLKKEEEFRDNSIDRGS